ncbi:MAG: Gfo/Idh/MocA family protein [Leadbetterella sp.]
MKKIKWGIIGAGNIASKFASDLRVVPDAELVAIASTSIERANAFAEKFQIPHAFGTYEGIFDAKPDVIYVASWHPKHKDHTLLCLENGVATLCEKPFGMNFDEVQIMLKKAKEKGIFLMEALWSRFHPTFLQAEKWLSEKIIGNPTTFHADFGFKAEYDPKSRLFDPIKGGGALLDIGIYPAFFAYYFFGYPLEIFATHTPAPSGTDDTTTFIFKHEDNITSSLNCTVSATTNCEATIYGEKGKITIHSRFHETHKISYELLDGTREEMHFPRETHGYEFEAAHVNLCLQKGLLESPMMNHKNSQDLIRILDTIAQEAGIKYS